MYLRPAASLRDESGQAIHLEGDCRFAIVSKLGSNRVRAPCGLESPAPEVQLSLPWYRRVCLLKNVGREAASETNDQSIESFVPSEEQYGWRSGGMDSQQTLWIVSFIVSSS